MLRHITYEGIKGIIEAAEAKNEKSEGHGTFVQFTSADVEKILEGLPERQALVAKIEALGPEGVLELEALMWLGRGDAGRSFSENLEYARKSKDTHTADYIAEKSLSLPMYLTKGLETLRAASAG